MVKIEPTMTQSEFKEFLVEYEKAGQMIRTLTAALTVSQQRLNEQDARVKTLSEQNLGLVARIESITRITCPNVVFSA